MAADLQTASALLAEVVRSGFVEGHHRGSRARARRRRQPRARRSATPDAPVFPRSSNKPMQAVGMLEAGLDLDGELLALASRQPLRRAVPPRRRTPDPGRRRPGRVRPADTAGLPGRRGREARLVVAAGTPPAPLAMNCSGKHAAMLATCVANGWPTDTYRDPDHPLQQAAARDRRATRRRAGHGHRRRRLRRAAVRADPGRPGPGLRRASPRPRRARRSAGSPRRSAPHPDWLGGTRRDVTALIAGVPGLIAKDGAEGVYAAALPDGRAVALKIDDGGQRARPAGHGRRAARASASTPRCSTSWRDVPLLGGGRPVGEVRAAF